MKVTIYKCNLCDQQWDEDNSFGVEVREDGEVILKEPKDSEKHVCRSCIIAIRNFGQYED